MKGVIRAVGVFLVVSALAGWATALEIQVAPQMLVLSSAGGNLTVHTDVPFRWVENPDVDVVLAVNDSTVDEFRCYYDSQGYLVAQCDKDTAKKLIKYFDTKTETATVTLGVCVADQWGWDSEEISVKK